MKWNLLWCEEFTVICENIKVLYLILLIFFCIKLIEEKKIKENNCKLKPFFDINAHLFKLRQDQRLCLSSCWCSLQTPARVALMSRWNYKRRPLSSGVWRICWLWHTHIHTHNENATGRWRTLVLGGHKVAFVFFPPRCTKRRASRQTDNYASFSMGKQFKWRVPTTSCVWPILRHTSLCPAQNRVTGSPGGHSSCQATPVR